MWHLYIVHLYGLKILYIFCCFFFSFFKKYRPDTFISIRCNCLDKYGTPIISTFLLGPYCKDLKWFNRFITHSIFFSIFSLTLHTYNINLFPVVTFVLVIRRIKILITSSFRSYMRKSVIWSNELISYYRKTTKEYLLYDDLLGYLLWTNQRNSNRHRWYFYQ